MDAAAESVPPAVAMSTADDSDAERATERANRGPISALIVSKSNRWIIAAEWLDGLDELGNPAAESSARLSVYLAAARARIHRIEFASLAPFRAVAISNDESILAATASHEKDATCVNAMLRN